MLVAHIGKLQETSRHCAKWLWNSPGKRYKRIRICVTGEVETLSSPIRRQNSGCETSGCNGGDNRILDVDIRVEWRRQQNSGCGHPGGKWRQPDGITTRVEWAGSHTPCILDLLMDSEELSSISDCFGDQKAIKTPKFNTIWLELIVRVLNMLIGLKGDNYYPQVFKRVNYKLWNSTF